jgi:hypothetical protein
MDKVRLPAPCLAEVRLGLEVGMELFLFPPLKRELADLIFSWMR